VSGGLGFLESLEEKKKELEVKKMDRTIKKKGRAGEKEYKLDK